MESVYTITFNLIPFLTIAKSCCLVHQLDTGRYFQLQASSQLACIGKVYLLLTLWRIIAFLMVTLSYALEISPINELSIFYSADKEVDESVWLVSIPFVLFQAYIWLCVRQIFNKISELAIT